jgi:hypothetical protein
MKPLPSSATDDDLLRFIDGWARLLEQEDYASAFVYTEQDPTMEWTPEAMRDVIKDYGDGRPNQRVSVSGVPSDVTQRKAVDRAEPNANGRVGGIWYDLNIDGIASDLTATFDIILDRSGLKVCLNDIHVM